METALGSSDWLVSDAFSLADSGLIPFFARLKACHCNRSWRLILVFWTGYRGAASARVLTPL